ncbi:hypothetical protein GCM10010254_22420 [Streptomyces chromofuscus]|nr:hypothetical protein GCM10010254_22420 [Streptomyces chromofuscus]
MTRATAEDVAVRELLRHVVQLWAAWHRVDLRPLVAEFRATILGMSGPAE